MRTIEFRFDVPDVDPQQFRNAIAYLTLWSLDRYDTVRIYSDGAFDLVAVYTNSDNQRYTIGAVWRPTSGEYTFHS